MTTNILVTGGAGFIGSHFVRHVLRETDWHVTVLDKLDEAGSQGRLEAAKLERGDRLQFVWHDLRAPINPVMLRSRGEFRYVVHMAAASHVDRSVKDPVGFVLDNVLGTAHLFQYCLIHNTPKKLLYFSTDEVFGPAPVGVSYYESDRLNPNNPYAASKAAAEVLCPAWANTFDLPITVTHCTNVYGPGQYAEKFIPLCAEKIRNGETVQIHARDGKPSSRYYVHVYDVCRAVMTVLMKGETIGSASTGRYNIAGDVEYSNLDVAKHIASLMVPQSLTAFRYELVDHVPNRPRHDMRYAVRDEKLRALGWKPRVGLTEGLRHVLLGEEPGPRTVKDLLTPEQWEQVMAYPGERPASPGAPVAQASPEPERKGDAGCECPFCVDARRLCLIRRLRASGAGASGSGDSLSRRSDLDSGAAENACQSKPDH